MSRAVLWRADGKATRFRRVAVDSQAPEVWTEQRIVVRRGTELRVLRREAGWLWVRTVAGEEGFVKSEHVAPRARVRRPKPTRLRRVASAAQTADVWTEDKAIVADGAPLAVLRREAGWAWV